MTLNFRVGHGIDLHRFISGRKLFLGGVEIPHDKGLDGHSDADVVLHAVMDALLGAVGMQDIGYFFPPTDPKWKDAKSSDLTKLVFEKISSEGWRVQNIDLTIVAEAPKISPYRDAIKEKVASLLKTSVDSVGVKATTAEGMGMIGKGEGIYATATVLIAK